MLIYILIDERLLALRAKYALQFQEEQEKAKHEIPFITEATLLALARELNLPLDPKTEAVLRSITGDLDFNSFYLARRMAENEFRSFPSTQKGFLIQVNQWLRKSYGNSQLVNAATVGMVYVFRAYHIQEGASLIDGLTQMPDGQTMTALDQTTEDLTTETGIVKRMLTGQRIPEHQVFLNQGLDILKLVSPHENEVEEGAIAMYRALSTLWPAIVDPSKRQMPKWY